MVVCLAYRHSLGIIVLMATVKNQLTGQGRIQEIREIFVTLVLLRSLKYFQLFCFNSCPFFFIKELVGHKWMGKTIKRKIQFLLRFVRQVVRGVECHAMVTTQ